MLALGILALATSACAPTSHIGGPTGAVCPPSQAAEPSANTSDPASASQTNGTATTPSALQGDSSQWKLSWQDTFGGSSVDPAKWNVEDDNPGGFRSGIMSEADQYMSPGNVRVQGGMLHIATEQRHCGSRAYVSGALNSMNKFDFLYGRVDIRARLPLGQGIWPAFWMLTYDYPGQAAWDTAHEIDIMEMLGSDPTTIYTTLHWHDYNDDHQCYASGADSSQGFHTYSIIWSASAVRWFIDGQQVCNTTQGVPTLPMYLLIDTAVGGSWPGKADATTPFPQFMDVEYVRVYQTAS